MSDADELPGQSRHQPRPQDRQRRSAAEWISVLGTDDPRLRQAITSAVGTRLVTLSELEEALGRRLIDPDRRTQQ